MIATRCVEDDYEAMVLGNCIHACGGELVSVCVDRNKVYHPYVVFFRCGGNAMIDLIDKRFERSLEEGSDGTAP